MGLIPPSEKTGLHLAGANRMGPGLGRKKSGARGAADARKHQIPRAKTRKTRVRGGKTSKNARRRALCATRRKKKGVF